MPVTLKEIAKSLNLSISTVSYALNDGPKPVSAEVRERVHQAVKDLGYRPNQIAKSLVTRRSNTIGVVPVDVGRNIFLGPYIQIVMNGIFNAAAVLRQDVLVFTGYDRNHPNSMTHGLLDARVDGVVFISPKRDSPAVQQIAESDLPFTVIGDERRSPSFTADNTLGVQMALDHLASLGHTRIAHITGDLGLRDASTRQETYLEFMKQRGFPVPPKYIIEGDFQWENGLAAGAKIASLTPRPTAVFCSNDAMARGLVTSLLSKGIRCPQDISIVGFDDEPGAETFQPPLTTVRAPVDAMATAAVKALVDWIEGKKVSSAQFQPKLIIRGSTAESTQ